LTLAGWGYVLFLGVGCSGAGYLLWCVALERLEASKVAVWLYLEPLVTVVVAVPVLAEPVGWLMIGGGLLVSRNAHIEGRRGHILANCHVGRTLTRLEQGYQCLLDRPHLPLVCPTDNR